jgi:hypothetical protein
MSTSQAFDPNLAPIGVGKENSPDLDDPNAAPIVDPWGIGYRARSR